MKKSLFLFPVFIFFFVSACQNLKTERTERYYINPYFLTEDFKKEKGEFFKTPPKVLDEAVATQVAALDPVVKTTLALRPNPLLLVLEVPYTEDRGKNWKNWEVGVGELYKDYAVRIDHVFGVDALSGAVKKLERPIIYLAFQPDASVSEEPPVLDDPIVPDEVLPDDNAPDSVSQ